MNPFSELQTRIRDLLTPAVPAAKILIEDKEGLQFMLGKALAPMSQPLILVGTASSHESQPGMGALALKTTFAIQLVVRPMFAKATDPLPQDMLVAVMTALHQDPLDPENAAPGNAVFRVTGHTLADAREGTVIYEITLTATIWMLNPPPDT